MSVPAIIALGGNIGDVLAHFRYAREVLQQRDDCRVVASSAVYRTPPVGPQDQDDYDNAVLLLQTTLPPLQLLDVLQAIEQDCHRERLIRWGARTLDLDIIDYDGRCYHDPRLSLPHHEAHRRAFVLQPLADIAPDWQHPRLQQSVATLLAAADRQGITQRQAEW